MLTVRRFMPDKVGVAVPRGLASGQRAGHRRGVSSEWAGAVPGSPNIPMMQAAYLRDGDYLALDSVTVCCYDTSQARERAIAVSRVMTRRTGSSIGTVESWMRMGGFWRPVGGRKDE